MMDQVSARLYSGQKRRYVKPRETGASWKISHDVLLSGVGDDLACATRQLNSRTLARCVHADDACEEVLERTAHGVEFVRDRQGDCSPTLELDATLLRRRLRM